MISRGQTYFLRSLISKNFPRNLTTEAQKRAVPSVLTTINRSDFVRFCENKSKGFWHEKTLEMAYFQGFSHLSWSRLTLRELRSTTCSLEAVLEQNQTLYPLILLGFQALGFPVSPFEPCIIDCLLISTSCESSHNILPARIEIGVIVFEVHLLGVLRCKNITQITGHKSSES